MGDGREPARSTRADPIDRTCRAFEHGKTGAAKTRGASFARVRCRSAIGHLKVVAFPATAEFYERPLTKGRRVAVSIESTSLHVAGRS